MNDKIDKGAYLQFDSLTLRQKIKDMLTESGVFTDQVYEGSNISTLIDIISYTFNMLMFYLNTTSSETMFSDAQIYENMNRIVKMLDYKPIGKQTATLSFDASAAYSGGTDSVGFFTIPRYSYFQVGNIPYSFNEDITISKTTEELEYLDDLSGEKLLFQGKFEEYPTYTAIGDENEILHLVPGKNVNIDHFNIHVYVKSVIDGTWSQWTQTPSLYLEKSNASKYEVRLNESKQYDIKFGNDINGAKLNTGDTVAVYYLRSLGESGEVGSGAINGVRLTRYATTQFNQILDSVSINNYTYLTDFTSLQFTNSNPSTFSSTEETVDDIRENAPGVFRSQYRLVTTGDYEIYTTTNFSNLIDDVKAVNNWSYVSEYMKYYYDLGITSSGDVSRALYNQVMYGDACNFNNVYVIVTPKIATNSIYEYSYLTPSQKEYIISSMRSEKTLTSEVILLDPVYVACAPGMPASGSSVTEEDVKNTKLIIVKDPTSRRDNSSILSDVEDVFTTYFSRANVSLGQTVDVKTLSYNILAIPGVKSIYTGRIDDDSNRVSGLSLAIWNPVYPNDNEIATKNVVLDYFKYPYFYNPSSFSSRIEIESESRIYEGVEY